LESRPARRVADSSSKDPALDLAMHIDDQVRLVRPDGWRGVQAREQVIKAALYKVTEANAAPRVTRKHSSLHLQVRPGADKDKKREIMDVWYREQLKEESGQFIEKWERVIGVTVDGFFVQSMKTKWGSANPENGTIRLNTELAKKPKQCLEYLVVHEMVHLLEATHNHRFQALMDRFMPRWHLHRQELNRLPVRHESWFY